MEREIYRQTDSRWILSEIKDIKVGESISIHEDGKYKGIFKAMSPPYQEDGVWTIQVSCMGE